ncbi:MAG: VOC family protein [Nitriliruptoraceae bacterium]
MRDATCQSRDARGVGSPPRDGVLRGPRLAPVVGVRGRRRVVPGGWQRRAGPLFGHDDLAEESGLDTPPSTRTGSMALATNLASETEVDALLEAAERAGGRVTRPATRADWGGWSGYFADPDGHLWEVAHNPGFPLDADGRVHLPR